MEFVAFTEQQLIHARNAVEVAQALRAQAKRVIDKLAMFSQDDFIQRNWGLSISPSDDGQTAELKNPFGAARADFAVHLGDEGLFGRYVIQRLGKDHLDRVIWRDVWAFRIDNEDRVTFGDKGDRGFEIWAPVREDYFRLLESIAVAVGQ